MMSGPLDRPAPATGWSRSTSPYHRGEQMVQERADSREFAERIGRQVIRDHLTAQHADFYSLPLVFVGSLDAAGRPWASVLLAEPGFVVPLEPKRLRVRARPLDGDPLATNLIKGAPIGMVGVQFETRRRNRVNGWLADVGPGGFDLRVGQAFGNCPQYIQARAPRSDVAAAAGARGIPAAEGPLLSRRAVAIAEASDTFFVASASPQAGTSDPVAGADVNHRGGLPGFVRVVEDEGSSLITWPDFVGNSAFNTLGNITLNPVAGLLFIDFASGDVLSVTGTAEILWDDPAAKALRGAKRLVQLRVTEGVVLARAVPASWSPPAYASQLARTGTWATPPVRQEDPGTAPVNG